MHNENKLRVAIDCRIGNPQQGVGTAVSALANALSQSQQTTQEYTFIVSAGMRDWLEPHIFGHCRLEVMPSSHLSGLKPYLRWLLPLLRLWRKGRKRKITVPVSDGYIEAERFDVVHFPTQVAFSTSLPSIYQPWDLQHLHYPQFFSAEEHASREMRYRAFCEQASYVCVQTEWTKRDLIMRYPVAAEKVAIIPWGSVFDSYQEPSAAVQQATIAKFGLPGDFFFYPAVTWPHKNHEVILRALHLLQKKHRVVHVYFTGASTDFRTELDEIGRQLNVSQQVHYLGFVTPDELQSVFRGAAAMLFPSKFEGFGLPLLEAFHAGVPVLCANATVLPEVAQDAALYFDPDSPAELVGLMIRIMDEPGLRDNMTRRGRQILSQFSIHRTASQFQELYDLVALRPSRDTYAGSKAATS